jgi:hypothetical protein
MNNLTHTFDDLLETIKFQNIDYKSFRKQFSILDISDTTGMFTVRSNIDTFLDRVATKEDDCRKDLVEVYCEKMYQILVTDAEKSLREFYTRYGELKEPIDFYFDLPAGNCLTGDTFMGMTNSKYGRICKNINFDDFYNTKKLYSNDSQYVFGLIKVMYEKFHIRNSLVGPAFFDHIINTEDEYGQFWLDFWIGANKASIFNPYTFKSILDTQFTGDVLFSPCMGWNAYQLGFYNSEFTHMVSTDVIPNVIDNAEKLHTKYLDWKQKDTYQTFFEEEDKTTDFYCCPSEQLDTRHNFVEKYDSKVDAVLFCPPYFDLEMYPGEEQSTESFPDYADWLIGYWEETVKLCKAVMKTDAKFGFIISNYRNHDKIDTTISQDMKNIVEKHLSFNKHMKVRWSGLSSSRQAHKQREGNYEDLWIFTKK